MASVTAQTLARFLVSYTNEIVSGINSPYTVDLPAGGAMTQWTNGTAAGAINLAYTEYTTISSTSVTRDLTTLAAAATNTGAATFTAIKGVLVRNVGPGTLVIGNAASVQAPYGGVGGTTDIVSLAAGGEYMWTDPTAAGQVVTTNKNLKLNCAAAVSVFTLSIIGLD